MDAEEDDGIGGYADDAARYADNDFFPEFIKKEMMEHEYLV